MNEENKSAADKERTTMQNAVQQMLPDDLKNKFVLQKNNPGAPEAAPKPTSFDPLGNPVNPPAQKLDPNLVQKPIRTYESDLAEALAQKQGSVASISIAESKRRESESRARESQMAAPAVRQVIRPTQSPIAPTRATAIPGASISLPPNMPKTIGMDMPLQPIVEPAPVTHIESVPVQKIAPPPMTEEVSVPRRSIAKPLFLTLASLIFIIGGLFAGFAFYKQSSLDEPAPEITPLVIPSIIPYDKQLSLPVGEESDNQLITKIYKEINKAQVSTGKNVGILLTEASGRPLSGSSFVNKLDTNIPDVITRSLTDRWMLGVYGEETGQKTTFVALTTDFFQNAFAGMLIWEDDDMAEDLALLLDFKDRARRDELNSTSTVSSYFTIRGNYTDKVIRNRDVREFRNPQGELLFLYSFINKETLLLTTTESAFIALVGRIEKDAYVR